MEQEDPYVEMGCDEFGNLYENIEKMWDQEFDKEN